MASRPRTTVSRSIAERNQRRSGQLKEGRARSRAAARRARCASDDGAAGVRPRCRGRPYAARRRSIGSGRRAAKLPDLAGTLNHAAGRRSESVDRHHPPAASRVRRVAGGAGRSSRAAREGRLAAPCRLRSWSWTFRSCSRRAPPAVGGRRAPERRGRVQHLAPVFQRRRSRRARRSRHCTRCRQPASSTRRRWRR